jgi:predicted dienelactone hydrolase
MQPRSTLAAVAACLLLPLALAPAAFAGSPKLPDPNDVGPYAIGHLSVMYEAPMRDWDQGPRPLPVEIFYPVDASTITSTTPEAVYPLDPINGRWPDTYSSDWEPYGNDPAYEGAAPSARKPFPLVVFSPGLGATIWGHNFLAGRVASHGFVVAVIYHYGDAFFFWEPWDGLAVTGANRSLDMSLVLDGLLEKNSTPGDPLAGVIDPTLIAASGWSYGGYAATVLAAGVDDHGQNMEDQELMMPWDPESLYGASLPPDPRIKAIVPLDGSSWVMKFHELARVSIPAMGQGQEWGTLAAGLPEGDPFVTWQARQHAAFQGKPNYRVDVADAHHGSFSNFCAALTLVIDDKGLLNDPTYPDWWVESTHGFRYWACYLTELDPYAGNRLVAKNTIAFLQTHLVGQAGYQNLLTPGAALKSSPKIEFFVTEKRSGKSIDEDWPDYFIYFPHQPGSEQFLAEKNPNRPIPRSMLGLPR